MMMKVSSLVATAFLLVLLLSSIDCIEAVKRVRRLTFSVADNVDNDLKASSMKAPQRQQLLRNLGRKGSMKHKKSNKKKKKKHSSEYDDLLDFLMRDDSMSFSFGGSMSFSFPHHSSPDYKPDKHKPPTPPSPPSTPTTPSPPTPTTPSPPTPTTPAPPTPTTTYPPTAGGDGGSPDVPTTPSPATADTPSAPTPGGGGNSPDATTAPTTPPYPPPTPPYPPTLVEDEDNPDATPTAPSPATTSSPTVTLGLQDDGGEPTPEGSPTIPGDETAAPTAANGDTPGSPTPTTPVPGENNTLGPTAPGASNGTTAPPTPTPTPTDMGASNSTTAPATPTADTTSVPSPSPASDNDDSLTPFPTSTFRPDFQGVPSDIPSSLPTGTVSFTGDESDNTPAPTTVDFAISSREQAVLEKCGTSQAERSAELLSIFSNISNPESFSQSGTPEYMAYMWMDNVDNYIACSDDASYAKTVQRYVVSLFYFALGGPGWDMCSGFNDCPDGSTPWLDGKDECVWYGITCDNDMLPGEVTKITLKSNGLEGTLPNEILELHGLSQLSLDHNAITGVIPSDIDQLISLTILELDENQMAGTIPDSLYNMAQLQAIDLNNNFFTGTLSTQIANLSKLVVLQLEYNSLEGEVPTTALMQLFNLILFSTNSNALTGSFESLCNVVEGRRMTNPTYLQFFSTDCDEIPCPCCTTCF